MALDLSALDAPPAAAGEVTGAPLQLPIDDVLPDPENPRKEKLPSEIEDIGKDIRERGVLLPISVKHHPTLPGKWQINDGELRYLGSRWAEMATVPAFVNDKFDDFDQVAANEKRYDLRPMELALFIKRKLDQGHKKADIARRLRKDGEKSDKPGAKLDSSRITHLLSLLDAPDFILAVYQSGRSTSVRTLYELRQLADKYPEAVAEWCAGAEEVTRGGIAALASSLKGEAGGKAAPANYATGSDAKVNVVDANTAADRQSLGHDQDTERQIDSGAGDSGHQSSDSGDASTKNSGGNIGIDQGEMTSWPRGKAVSDPDLLKKPLLLVAYQGRTAAVLLNRRPSDAMLWRIRFEDGGGDAEVPMSECTPQLLQEQPK